MATETHKVLVILSILFVLALACGSEPAAQSQNEPITRTIAERTVTELPIFTSTPIPTLPSIGTPSLAILTPTIKAPTSQALPTPFISAEGNANLRDGPGTNYEIVDGLSPGDSFAIIGRNTDASWWQISVDDRLVWVSADVVTASNTDQDIPIVEASPPPPIAPASTEAPVSELTPTPLPGSTLTQPSRAAPACDCSGDIYNCDDFKSREEAHACFDYCQSIGAGDIHNLDGDADGQFCESR